MFKIRLMIIAVAVAALTLGLSGLAFAAPINCGDCHGAETKSPAWEAPSLPMAGDLCSQQGRGLHGVHNNYSSQSYATGANAAGIRGNCNACHEVCHLARPAMRRHSSTTRAVLRPYRATITVPGTACL